MKREYQNPATNVVHATTSSVIMGSPYHDLNGSGTTNGGPGAAPGRIVYV